MTVTVTEDREHGLLYVRLTENKVSGPSNRMCSSTTTRTAGWLGSK